MMTEMGCSKIDRQTLPTVLSPRSHFLDNEHKIPPGISQLKLKRQSWGMLYQISWTMWYKVDNLEFSGLVGHSVLSRSKMSPCWGYQMKVSSLVSSPQGWEQCPFGDPRYSTPGQSSEELVLYLYYTNPGLSMGQCLAICCVSLNGHATGHHII